MKILILDNDMGVLENLKIAIDPLGHECSLFQKPEKAIEEFCKSSYDILIVELNLPEMNGLDVVRKIKKSIIGFYVIVIAGYADVESTIRAANLGIDGFFVKPINFKELIKTMSEIERKIIYNNKLKMVMKNIVRDGNDLKKLYYNSREILKSKGT